MPADGPALPGSADRSLPAGRLVLVATFAGLATGLVEFGIVQMVIHVGIAVLLSTDYVWMIPTAAVLFFLLAALALLGIGWLWPRARTPRVVAGVLVGLVALDLLLLVESLHKAAALVLAVGLGVQASRLAGGRIARRLYREAPAAALALLLVVSFLGVRQTMRLRSQERAARAALPAARAGAPNVLLLILDTVRARGLGLFDGGGAAAPQLARFAHNGVIFERALAPSPWTLPSHASMFTGHWAHDLSAGWTEPLDDTYLTLAEALAARGYITVGFVGNTMFATRRTGLGRGFVHYEDLPVSLGQLLLSSSLGRALAGSTTLRRIVAYHDLPNRKTAEEVTDAFLGWQRRNEGRPFFAFVNFFDAHEPYFPPGYSGSVLWPGRRWTGYNHNAGLVNGPSAWIGEKWELTPEKVRIHASGYWAAVRSADAQLGRLLGELDRRGVLENTIVIIAGDHGEQLGEHGLFEHNNSLYLPVLHVPLVILPPGGLARPARVAELVSLRDIPATVLDLLGDPPAPFPGRSLVPLWRVARDAGGGNDRAALAGDTSFAHLEQGLVRQPWYPVNRGNDMFSLTTCDYHYIRNGDGSEELYDWGRDPAESVNLAGQPAADSILAGIRRSLEAILGGG